ncbi:U7 snRNA-associated Sm-like protein LSm10 [Scaptodrosophila lebanonensis]|uniref:U7 snRNA-associated Sm-like protein LSm10 n=1 Tax=Drosophila lebanonensis TaxID=7225 RepID=A0A6J2UJ98_DROLE|nr:U7 snRNA-associated Sm-like protein LSm10 [Scaptodrosophila lebanonensis]
MQHFSAREKFLISNTLNCVPMMIQGHAVLIDLRNETSVAGVVDMADGQMNIELSNVVLIDRNGHQYAFDYLMVRNRMIRQLHIPPTINMQRELPEAMERGILRRKRVNKTNTKRTFKQKRAEEKHKEIMAQITKQKQTESLMSSGTNG